MNHVTLTECRNHIEANAQVSEYAVQRIRTASLKQQQLLRPEPTKAPRPMEPKRKVHNINNQQHKKTPTTDESTDGWFDPATKKHRPGKRNEPAPLEHHQQPHRYQASDPSDDPATSKPKYQHAQDPSDTRSHSQDSSYPSHQDQVIWASDADQDQACSHNNTTTNA